MKNSVEKELAPYFPQHADEANLLKQFSNSFG
jgi:hypothetical protein